MFRVQIKEKGNSEERTELISVAVERRGETGWVGLCACKRAQPFFWGAVEGCT